MTTSTKTRAKASTALVKITGRGKAERELAFMSIAPASFSAEQGRAHLIATLDKALGDNPTDEQKDVAKREYVIGRATSRMPAGEFPKGCGDAASRMEHVRKLVCEYQAPSTAVSGRVPKLRRGKIGWRTAIQNRVIRNAEESWSLIAGELRIGQARTMAEKNSRQKDKRAPHHNSKASDKPSHAELVQPAKPLTPDEACQHIVTQAAALLAYANKHAKLLPADFGKAVQQFKAAINKAANDKALADAARDAKRAETAK